MRALDNALFDLRVAVLLRIARAHDPKVNKATIRILARSMEDEEIVKEIAAHSGRFHRLWNRLTRSKNVRRKTRRK
jgi:hypothetical protein